MGIKLKKCCWIENFNRPCNVLLGKKNKTIYCEKHLRVWREITSSKVASHLKPRQIAALIGKLRTDLLKRLGPPEEVVSSPSIIYSYGSLEMSFDTEDKVELIYDNPERGGSGILFKY